MADAIDPKFLDKRTAPRYILSGQLDEKTYERLLKGLPDSAEKAVAIEADAEFNDDDIESDEVEA